MDEPTLILIGVAGWATVESWAHLAESNVPPAVRRAEALALFLFPAALALWSRPRSGYSPAVEHAVAVIGPWLISAVCLWRRFAVVFLAAERNGRLLQLLPRTGGSLFGWAGVLLIFLASALATVSVWLRAWSALPLMVSLMLAGMGVATSFGEIALYRRALLIGHGGLQAEIPRAQILAHTWLRDEQGTTLQLALARRTLLIRRADAWANSPEALAWLEQESSSSSNPDSGQ